MTRVPNKKVPVLVTRSSQQLKAAALERIKNSRIQIYIKKEWMFQFESLFKKCQSYSISNFAITENSGKLPLLPYKYKISFYKGIVVTRIDPFDENLNGFILEPFNRLFDGTRYYHKHEAIGTPSIHNALFGTKMFINCDFPEIEAFRQRFKELPEYDANQFKISVFTPQKPFVTSASFIDNIRRYNSMFAFTSMGDGQPAMFAQLYIFDTENEIQNRIGAVSNGESSSSRNNELDYQLTTDIRDLLDEINPLVQDFHKADEHIRSSDDEKISLRLIVTRQ
nr:hypothetical protein [Tanacetum cinerariifolium]